MTVANHLTLNELWRRAKKAKDPIEKDRFLAVYHAKRGLTAKEIASNFLAEPRNLGLHLLAQEVHAVLQGGDPLG
jgi:hypothetical protein